MIVRIATPVISLALVAAACTGASEPTVGQPRGGRPTATGTEATVAPAASPTVSPSESPSPVPDDPGARVWVAVEDGRRLVQVDVARRRVLRRVPVPGEPHNITVGADGIVAATLQGAGSIVLVRHRRVDEVELGGSPHDVKATGNWFVVANEGAARLDLVRRSGRHVGSIPLKADPHDLAVAPGGDAAWVTLDGSDEIAVVDLRRRRVRRYVPTGARPHDLLFAPDERLWVTDWGGALHVLSRRGDHIETLELGDEAHHLTFAPRRPRAWVVDHGTHRLFLVHTETLRVLGDAAAQAPHHVALTADGRFAAVALHERGMLAIYSASGSRLGSVPVGPGPHGVWAVP